MKNNLRKFLPFTAVALIILIDQAVKYWAVIHLQYNDMVELIPNVFYLKFALNNGAALSIFSGQRFILLAVSVVSIAMILFIIIRGWVTSVFGKWGIYFVLGGALGNFIDRVFRSGGYVVDLFYFSPINFPIFNVADIFISVGGAMFCIYVLFSTLREHKKQNPDDGSEK